MRPVCDLSVSADGSIEGTATSSYHLSLKQKNLRCVFFSAVNELKAQNSMAYTFKGGWPQNFPELTFHWFISGAIIAGCLNTDSVDKRKMF